MNGVARTGLWGGVPEEDLIYQILNVAISIEKSPSYNSVLPKEKKERKGGKTDNNFVSEAFKRWMKVHHLLNCVPHLIVMVQQNKPPEPEEEEEVKEGVPEEIYKPPVRKPWVSLGSEKEIEEESVRESTRRVVLWDISEYEERLKSAKSGTAAGTAVNMVNRMGTVFENRAGVCVQFMTCSPDCTIYVWDLRVYRPTIQTSAEKKKEEGIINVPPDVPTTFKHLDLAWKPLIKDGEVLYSDWKMERDGDSGRLLTKQHFLAVADDFGTLHILEISWSLIHPSSNEKVVGGQRSRELMEEQTSQNYVEFLDLEKTILVRLGLLKGPDKYTPSRIITT
ncbi:WD repeat-containing protein 63 [Crotalus adamanteus]|uniref:WD repeat-containing protein 63 n=1 Tax=Crotalus adamanteus TaxID=8729 RepID=A0AAW1BQK0_CROAD